MVEDEDQQDDVPSKSAKKRELAELRLLGEKLLSVPPDRLGKLNADVLEAINAGRKITKGGARKRQLQYIAKLLRTKDDGEAQQIVDALDASTKTYNAQFHELERWRERLVEGDDHCVTEVIEKFPAIDRQHFRNLVKNAINERTQEHTPPLHFRKLFQFLKSLKKDEL